MDVSDSLVYLAGFAGAGTAGTFAEVDGFADGAEGLSAGLVAPSPALPPFCREPGEAEVPPVKPLLDPLSTDFPLVAGAWDDDGGGPCWAWGFLLTTI